MIQEIEDQKPSFSLPPHHWLKIPNVKYTLPPPQALIFLNNNMRGKPGAGEGYNGGPLLPQRWLAPTRS